MSGFRLPNGGLIDRSRNLPFRFDGRDYVGNPGDTIVSALLANGVRVMGRSFKFHRPRGAWSSWFDDPNAIFSVSLSGDELPNCPGATTPLVSGMEVRAVNVYPSAQHDIKGALDLFHNFISAGFYYKMFMWPDWHLFEPGIRKMAGLGRLERTEIEGYESDQTHDACDLLIVGAGPAGLAAAREAAEAGQSVVLIDDHVQPGGSGFQFGKIENEVSVSWIASQLSAFESAGGRILTGATAFGIYNHQLVAIAQYMGFAKAPRLIRMRAKRCLLATGAFDRPVTFANNDRPGVMSLNGATDLLARYGVLVGRRIAVIAPNSLAASQAAALRAAGAEVQIVAPDGQAEALGGKILKSLRMGHVRYDCDTILTSAGLTPVLHLWSHAGGKLNWDETACAFVPAVGPDWISVIGAANGTFGLDDALAEARSIAVRKRPPERKYSYGTAPLSPVLGSRKRQWIDFQHDVTVKDIELAARENYISVEHLKRYTTLGMASDQGKTSNVAGLSTMAALRDKSIPETGTTTFRPPFVPVPFELYRGAHRQQQFHPLKRLPLEDRHRAAGAALGEYGGWLRPGWYGEGDQESIVQNEILVARENAGILDASPLGKIEIMGPDAEKFVNFIFYNTISTLKSGHIRYGFILTESGIVFDDGVIARVDENRFIIFCSSGHVDNVVAHLEAWRQDGNDPDRVYIQDTTQNWPTLTVCGPKAREIVLALDLGVDLSPEAFPHMHFRIGQFDGAIARIARVSFTGDISYEISVPVAKIQLLWDKMIATAAKHGAAPIGLEALSILRAEKGYVIIGKDTDGETMPHDLGFGVPRRKKKSAFVGDRSLHNENACRVNRRHFVGLAVPNQEGPLPTGAHIVTRGKREVTSRGFVSSSYYSATLRKPIALGLVDAELAIDGAELEIFHLGKSRLVYITSPCFFDPEGELLHA